MILIRPQKRPFRSRVVDGWPRNGSLAMQRSMMEKQMMHVCRAFGFWLGLALTATVFCGCRGDREPERVVVSGKVTYNGKPIGEGEIRFVPSATTVAPVSGASIKDGQYRADIRGGVPVGAHTIQIEAYRPDTSKMPPNQSASQPSRDQRIPMIQYIPKRYNLNSEMKITIDSGSKPLTKDLDLTD
jgi:hypothetical protein